jgi:hypothetical protein
LAKSICPSNVFIDSMHLDNPDTDFWRIKDRKTARE